MLFLLSFSVILLAGYALKNLISSVSLIPSYDIKLSKMHERIFISVLFIAVISVLVSFGILDLHNKSVKSTNNTKIYYCDGLKIDAEIIKVSNLENTNNKFNFIKYKENNIEKYKQCNSLSYESKL